MDSREGVIFCQDDFTHESFAAFDDMRGKEEFVDFKITFGNRCIMGHRVILAARIPHFRTLFLGSEEEEVFLSETDPDVLESIINFAYSGRIEITPRNVGALLSASKVLQLTRVYEECWKFVAKILHSNNVLEFRKFAEDDRCPKYLDLIDNYIIQNFEEFAKSESLLVFPFQKLKEVISRDDIKVSTEEDVFEAVIRWVKGSLSERRDQLPELLSAVRMYFLKPEFLIKRVSNDELVRSSHLCRDLVDEAKSYHMLPDKRSHLGRLPPQPRIYKYYSMISSSSPLINMYAFCCFEHRVSVKMLNHNSRIWSEVSKFRVSDVDAVAELTGIIYIFENSNISTFDLKTFKWNVAKNPGNMDVSYSGAVTCNNRIYFFGGLGNESRRVRFFDPDQRLWIVDGYMNRCIYNPGVACLGEFIYVTGGMFGGKTSRAVELFNSQNRKWTKLLPMNSGRYDHGCCSLDGNVYVCGGFFTEDEILRSAEVYYPKTNQWNNISAMKEPMYKLSVVSNFGKIFSMGRTDKHSRKTANMQVYDPSDAEWNDDVAIPDIENHTAVYLVSSEAK